MSLNDAQEGAGGAGKRQTSSGVGAGSGMLMQAVEGGRGGGVKRQKTIGVDGGVGDVRGGGLGGITEFGVGSDGEWDEMLKRLGRFVSLHGHVRATH